MNPGNLKTELQRHLPWLVVKFFHWISYAPVYGAYTELFSGFSPEITLENSGCWVIPFGRLNPIREDIAASGKPVSEGGSDIGIKFWEWCEKQVEPYL
jgi:retinol dehydrogenase-12